MYDRQKALSSNVPKKSKYQDALSIGCFLLRDIIPVMGMPYMLIEKLGRMVDFKMRVV